MHFEAFAGYIEWHCVCGVQTARIGAIQLIVFRKPDLPPRHVRTSFRLQWQGFRNRWMMDGEGFWKSGGWTRSKVEHSW